MTIPSRRLTLIRKIDQRKCLDLGPEEVLAVVRWLAEMPRQRRARILAASLRSKTA